MEIKKELDHKLFMQREENIRHVNYEIEFSFYKAVARGDTEKVKSLLNKYLNIINSDSSDQLRGILSDNPLQSEKYHFVVLAAMLTRYCLEAGLLQEICYNLSDIYIQRADKCSSIDSLLELKIEMINDFTSRMKEQHRKNIYSKQINQCIDYIYENLHQRLTVHDLAKHFKMNESYFSKLFTNELGVTPSAYIRKEKLKAAANMLQQSDYDIVEISEYLGFSTQSHFTSIFKAEYGITPKQYRNLYHNKTMPDL